MKNTEASIDNEPNILFVTLKDVLWHILFALGKICILYKHLVGKECLKENVTLGIGMEGIVMVFLNSEIFKNSFLAEHVSIICRKVTGMISCLKCALEIYQI